MTNQTIYTAWMTTLIIIIVISTIRLVWEGLLAIYDEKGKFQMKQLENGNYIVYKKLFLGVKKYYRMINNKIYEMDYRYAKRMVEELNIKKRYLIK